MLGEKKRERSQQKDLLTVLQTLFPPLKSFLLKQWNLKLVSKTVHPFGEGLKKVQTPPDLWRCWSRCVRTGPDFQQQIRSNRLTPAVLWLKVVKSYQRQIQAQCSSVTELLLSVLLTWNKSQRGASCNVLLKVPCILRSTFYFWIEILLKRRNQYRLLVFSCLVSFVRSDKDLIKVH